MLKIIISFICIVIYKVLSNAACLFNISRYEKEFVKLPTGNSKIFEHKQHVVKLWKRAGISDVYMPMTKPLGFGQIANMNVSIFTNFPSLQKAQFVAALNLFDEAKGVYKSRILESVNPLFWIDLLVFLPKNILLYLGMSEQNVAFKILNVIMQGLWWIACAAVAFFHDDVKRILLDVINKF